MSHFNRNLILYMRMCTHAYIHTNMHVHACAHTHTHTCACVCVCALLIPLILHPPERGQIIKYSRISNSTCTHFSFYN